MPRDMLSPAAPTLEGMIEWLKTRDPNEEYRYTDSKGCLVFQFLQHLGYSVYSVGPHSYLLDDHIVHRLPIELNWVALEGFSSRRGNEEWRTFGDALVHAERLAALSPEDRKMEMCL